ncbi:MAG: hypothetical protein RI907_2167 [Pseudomonadota bacterium]|jgi:Fic family protein
MRSTGRYLTVTTLGETVRAFLPHALPPADPPLQPGTFEAANTAATRALDRLAAVAGLVPSLEWLLYGAVRQEALSTSLIEGTQATLVDLFDSEAGLALPNGDDVEEVTNYLRAFKWTQAQLRDPAGLPISTRLLCEAHRRLMDGVRGATKQPGELRRSQNWIGGARPGPAVFVPPPPEHVAPLLSDLERFIHEPTPSLPPLVRIALVHAQFETIHPFLDGNGRIGRLLIAALVEQWGLLPQPLMYLSGFLKQHQSEYYRHLSAIRTQGDWEGWIAFFLAGVEAAAQQAERNIVAIASLIQADRRRLMAEPKAGVMAYRLFELLPTMPRLTIERARATLGTTAPTATAAMQLLAQLGVVLEITGQKKNRCYSYQAYVDLLAG